MTAPKPKIIKPMVKPTKAQLRDEARLAVGRAFVEMRHYDVVVAVACAFHLNPFKQWDEYKRHIPRLTKLVKTWRTKQQAYEVIKAGELA